MRAPKRSSLAAPDQITQLFNYLGNQVRVVTIDGEPWFVAADVCRAMGFNLTAGTGQFLQHIDRADRRPVPLGTFEGKGMNQATLISESGLYSLVMRAQRKNPTAKAFQDWVTGVVLPTLRKDKQYNIGEEKVRIIMQDDEPWFLGMDVLTILGLNNMAGAAAMAYRRLDPTDKSYVSRTYVGLSPGRQVTLISEGGLYQLIMRSDKEAAKPFQRWVTHTVLPTLRKDKQYNVGEEKVRTGEMTIEEMTLMVMENLQSKVAKALAERDAALNKAEQLEERLNFITVAEYLALDKRYMQHGQKTKLGQMAKSLKFLNVLDHPPKEGVPKVI